ncbi:MAG TPA: hypothetical protein VFH63_00545 [candidate division Zixibacteria bacterium]|nr:hypothetical protein [candidate division Zixibacteria bacterium]
MLPAIALAALLGTQLSADPAAGVTFSNSPFTDEGWNVMGARNVVLLGDWGAGNWSLHLVQLPFTLAQAAGFALMGVGIVQARIVALLCTVGAVALIGLATGRRLGAASGVLAGLALGSCALVLYYGRLVFIEDIVLLSLAGGLALLVWRDAPPRLAITVAAGALLAIAVGSKPLALFSVLGILAGILVAGDRAWRVRALLAAAVVTAMGVGWVLLIGLPNAERIGFVLQIWAEQRLPENFGQLVERVVTYPLPGRSDRTVLLSLPLSAVGAAGLLAAVLRWRSLAPDQKVLAGAAVGWLVLGVGVLLVASYRPNRYALPYLPALAVLSGFALPPARAWLSRLRPIATGLAAGLAAALVVAPGMASYASWALAATHEGPRLQAEVASLIGRDPAPVEGGLAPFLAMTAPVPIHVRWASSQVNSGDLYADAGVRWMVLTGTQFPLWAEAHPEAWEGRRELGCYAWGEGRHCLLHFPEEAATSER